jgi:hypothetical protein
MSPNQTLALKALGECYSEDYGYMSFAMIHHRSGLPRDLVRRTVRALARKGLAEFSSGLWNDNGEPAGSGYKITAAGLAALSSQERK